MNLKLPILAAVLLLASFISADTFEGMEYVTSGDVVPGQWNTQYDKCVSLSLTKKLPMVVFWGRKGCGYCKKLAAANATSKVVNWRKERGYIFLLGIEGEPDSIGRHGDAGLFQAYRADGPARRFGGGGRHGGA